MLHPHEMKYTVILEREANSGFVVTVPVLPGRVSQGNTREEALRNSTKQLISMSKIAAWLETLCPKRIPSNT